MEKVETKDFRFSVNFSGVTQDGKAITTETHFTRGEDTEVINKEIDRVSGVISRQIALNEIRSERSKIATEEKRQEEWKKIYGQLEPQFLSSYQLANPDDRDNLFFTEDEKKLNELKNAVRQSEEKVDGSKWRISYLEKLVNSDGE